MAGVSPQQSDARIAIALRGTLVSPTASGEMLFAEDGLLLLDAEGTIRYAGPRNRSGFRGPVRDVRPGLIVPGFVDAHTHFPQTRIIGCATGPLLDWLRDSVFPEEARYRRAAYARAVAQEWIARLLQSGTTTVAAFSSSSPAATEVAFEALADSGLRAIVGLTWMDQRAPKPLCLSTRQAVVASQRLVRRWHGYDRERLRFAVTPRFALSCSRGMLRAAGDLAREHDLPVQTHVAENLREGLDTLKAHPYATSYLDVYDRAGLLGPRTILAHAIHLRARDRKRIAETGTAIAHCPDSNFFLGSGRMKLAAAREAGIKVALGSDVAAGRSFSIRRAMAYAYDNALAAGHAVTPGELLRLATLEGAAALGCAHTTGSLEPGKDGDAVVVALRAPVRTLDAALAALIFDNDDVAVTQAWVRGRRLL